MCEIIGRRRFMVLRLGIFGEGDNDSFGSSERLDGTLGHLLVELYANNGKKYAMSLFCKQKLTN